ncbi:T9SS type A sorting domain-containing protein [Brumimicrobium oceani]|uniref:T9SS type A sorting domain-containing protein n=1 Tax=Brumimicrobium oceani TaxID=2100725 RepID=UPI001304D6EF|nr:T9SS type A sorting domain-containing protein [Brumimicrobium oceani]
MSFFGQPHSTYAEYSTSKSLSSLSEENKAFEIYPNPATESINFRSLNNLEITEVKIVNSLGAIMKMKTQNNMTVNDTNMNVGDLENGVYFVKIKAKNGTILNRKFIKK